MDSRLLRLTAVGIAASWLAPGCAPVENSGAPGPFAGQNAQLAAANINRAGTANVASSVATGAPTGTIAVAVTAIIAKHQASERQRQVAVQRAKATYTRLVAKQKAATRPAGAAQVAGKPHAYRVPRYIAVDTEKNAQDVPGTKKAVMIWDTQAQEIVGNNVYDVATPPAVGSNSRFETFSAEYVGAGL
jgi:hypothetical protein